MDHDNMLSETENIHFCGAGFSLISTSTLKREKKKRIEKVHQNGILHLKITVSHLTAFY